MEIVKLTEQIRKDEIKLLSLNEMILSQVNYVFCDNVIAILKHLRKQYLELKDKINSDRLALDDLKQSLKNKGNQTIGMAR